MHMKDFISQFFSRNRNGKTSEKFNSLSVIKATNGSGGGAILEGSYSVYRDMSPYFYRSRSRK